MEVNFSTLHLHLQTSPLAPALRLHLVPPTLSRLCRLSVVFCPRAQLWGRPSIVRIREIRNSWTVTSVRAHLVLGHLEGRGRGRSDFVFRWEAGRISCRPQGAFVAGGVRRRRLSWSRPLADRWHRVGRFARTRNGALRRSRKPAYAGRESVRVARRDTKTLRHVFEERCK